MRVRQLPSLLLTLASCAGRPPPPPRVAPPVVREAPPVVLPPVVVRDARLGCRTGAADASRAFDHVVIVSFDGMRPDGMEDADAPTLHRLREEGASAQNAQTIEQSLTLPSHASMLAGVEVSVHGMDFDIYRPERGFIRATTTLQLVHQAGMASAMFVAKDKLRHIATPGSLDVWSLPGATCRRVSTAAARYLADAGPGETFVHFGEPDVSGHHHGWMSSNYLRAIERADRCLATVLDAVAARGDRTLLIVTADHGGHGRAHGAGTEIDRHIPWIAWGPCVRRGPFAEPVRTTDTAATVLAALGVAPPAGMTGHVVTAAFGADGDAPAR